MRKKSKVWGDFFLVRYDFKLKVLIMPLFILKQYNSNFYTIPWESQGLALLIGSETFHPAIKIPPIFNPNKFHFI